MNKAEKVGTGVPKTPEQKETKKIVDFSFLDILEKFGPESEEVRKLSEKREEGKIISKIASIINGDNIHEREDLRRELSGLSDYKKGAITSLINLDMSLDEKNKRDNTIIDRIKQ